MGSVDGGKERGISVLTEQVSQLRELTQGLNLFQLDKNRSLMINLNKMASLTNDNGKMDYRQQ